VGGGIAARRSHYSPSSAFAQHLGGIIGGPAVQQRRGCGARQRAQQRPCHLRAGFTQHWS
jgi:hypothetical protein